MPVTDSKTREWKGKNGYIQELKEKLELIPDGFVLMGLSRGRSGTERFPEWPIPLEESARRRKRRRS